MDLHVDDDGFVRAPATRCYRLLTDVAAWPAFWPRTEVVDHGDDVHRIVAGRGRRRLRFVAEAGGWRHEQGFTLVLTGDLSGRWEVWLEPGWGGTVVHHLLDARGRSVRQHAAFRRWVRAGLWAAKDLLEHEATATADAATGTGSA